MKKENYNEPIYENLELYSGLDLVYRHPCLHFRADSHECSNCKYGKAGKCKIDKEYQKISEFLKLSEEVKKIIDCETIDYADCICIDCLFHGEEREKILKWLDYKI